MKRTNKLIAFIAVFLILLTNTFSVPVFAAGVHYSCSSTSGYTGDTVTVSVSASASTVEGCLVSLGYNTSELQYISHARGGIVIYGNPNPNGSRVTFAGSINGSRGGTIFTVTFKILKTSGSCSLTVSASGGGDNVDHQLNPVPFTTSGGKITVKEKAVTTTQAPTTTQAASTTETTTKAETTTEGIAVASISLNKSSLSLEKGDTASLSVTVSPSNATNKKVSYRTSNIYVARVNDSGKVTAVGGGTATITASAGGKSTTCKVSVSSKQTGITHSGKSTKSIEVGQTMTLTVEKVPSDATDTFITTWSSSDTSVVTISEGGVITGVKEGTATITAVSHGWTVKYTIEVLPKTEESTTEADTTDTATETSSVIEDTTIVTTTTEPFTDDEDEGNIISKLINIVPENGNKNQRQYYAFAALIAFVIIAAVAITVSILVTHNIKKNKDKSKDPNGPEDK